MHLAGKDANDEWQDLERKLKRFVEKAELERTGEGVGDALQTLRRELKAGYERMRRALTD
jgi:hypothetical protein